VKALAGFKPVGDEERRLKAAACRRFRSSPRFSRSQSSEACRIPGQSREVLPQLNAAGAPESHDELRRVSSWAYRTNASASAKVYGTEDQG
jgi:hypothetical protein